MLSNATVSAQGASPYFIRHFEPGSQTLAQQGGDLGASRSSDWRGGTRESINKSPKSVKGDNLRSGAGFNHVENEAEFEVTSSVSSGRNRSASGFWPVALSFSSQHGPDAVGTAGAEHSAQLGRHPAALCGSSKSARRSWPTSTETSASGSISFFHRQTT